MTETGELTYIVNGQSYSSRNEAIRAATENAQNYFSETNSYLFGTKNNFLSRARMPILREQQLQIAEQFGLIIKLKNDPQGNQYQIGDKKYKNEEEAILGLADKIFDENGKVRSDAELTASAQVTTNVKVQNTIKISNQKEL